MSSSVDTAVPIIVLVTLVTLIGAIYGTLELYDNESSAWDVLKDLLSGEITLWDIWEGKKDRSGVCQGPDTNAVYEYNEKGDCTFLGCKPGYFEQNGICIQQRDRSDDVYGGQEAVDCEYDGYEDVGTCILKNPNITCGIGVGTIQRQPNVVRGAIGGGSCPSMIEVDCDIKCPDICTIKKDEAYKEVENAEVKATDDDGEIVILGKATGFCGTGTSTREYSPQSISNQFLLNEGYDSLQEYLDEVNPGGVCPESEPYSRDVPCEIGDNGQPMRDVSCSYGFRVYEDIKSGGNTGESACFKTSVAEDFIAGNISFTALQEGELPIITPEDVPLDYDGKYDWSQVSDDKRKGRKIKYLSSLGVSAQALQDNKCTLMMTEECDARVQDVDCVIGDTNVSDCISPGCGQQMYQTVTRGVVTKQFGNGEACPPDYKTVVNRTDPTTCDISLKCCGDSDYVGNGTCKNDGKMTYTLNTTSCDRNGLPETKEVDCCYQSGWSPEQGYDGCELIGNTAKRKFTRTVTSGCTGDNAITEEYRNNGDCCYIGDWVKGECNQDDQLDRVKYTRTVDYARDCTRNELRANVGEDDIFDIDDPTVKYVTNTDECYSICGRERIGDHRPPYEQLRSGGGPLQSPAEDAGCYGTYTYRVTKAGKGTGLRHPLCESNNVGGLAVGDTFEAKSQLNYWIRTCPPSVPPEPTERPPSGGGGPFLLPGDGGGTGTSTGMIR